MNAMALEAVVDALIELAIKIGGELLVHQRLNAWTIAKQAADIEAAAKFGPK